MLLEPGAANSPSMPTAALEKAPSCPVLWCLQGDKAFLSACPSLLLSGDFVECRSSYEAVYMWGVSRSPLQQEQQRSAQHMQFAPLHLNGGGAKPSSVQLDKLNAVLSSHFLTA